MARKPRLEFAGAIYHVLNRGNYRQDLFEKRGSAAAFVACLLETCERMGWVLHAYCVMRNHYHLAVGTPRGNLVRGVHWLQSTFGNRFNRFRGENGRAFQGRYKAILVEPGLHLAQLVDYIHLNPVRAGLIAVEQLSAYRWGSYGTFQARKRPSLLQCHDWLTVFRGLDDSPEGWAVYRDHLIMLSTDTHAQRAGAFDRMCRGFALGSQNFERTMAERFQTMKTAATWGGMELGQINEARWEELLARGASVLNQSPDQTGQAPKSAPWKIALAVWLKQRTSVHNRWLAEKLAMGRPDAVSRYTFEAKRGLRPDVAPWLDLLNASRQA